VFYLNAAGLKTSGSATVGRSLFLHEAVPGHHFQMALQRENAGLQAFRKFGWYNAFGEGWALYAESLGDELGIYQNRRDRLGMLNDELFRAGRLVVDVGLHEKGWSREQAIDYLRKTIGVSREGAEREAERYMAWPGQALSYKIGQLKILEIRKRAEQKLRNVIRRSRISRRAAERRRDAFEHPRGKNGSLGSLRGNPSPNNARLQRIPTQVPACSLPASSIVCLRCRVVRPVPRCAAHQPARPLCREI
jgi:hypothetical protein